MEQLFGQVGLLKIVLLQNLVEFLLQMNKFAAPKNAFAI
jgi:hypothetical protein